MNKLQSVVLSVLFALGAQNAHADGVSSLKGFYKQTQGLRAQFSQVVTDSQGKKIQEVKGNMLLQRPNKFRWDYQQPFEQQIISDGQQVYLYDVELQQVTVKSLGKAIGSSPAALLAGGEQVEKNFKLTNLPDRDGMERAQAVPINKENGFESVQLSFKAGQLAEMQMVDSFGQTTNIHFASVETNPTLNTKQFLFKAPKGVDVVGAD